MGWGPARAAFPSAILPLVLVLLQLLVPPTSVGAYKNLCCWCSNFNQISIQIQQNLRNATKKKFFQRVGVQKMSLFDYNDAPESDDEHPDDGQVAGKMNEIVVLLFLFFMSACALVTSGGRRR